MIASLPRVRAFRQALLLPALLGIATLLAACNAEKPGGDNATVVVSNGAIISKGAVVTKADEGESLELTTSLPAFAPAYPGARVTTRIGDSALPDGTAKGSVVIFSTPDPVAKVAAFYDAKAKELGLKAGMIVNDEDSAVRIFGTGDKDDKAEGALIAISKADDGKGSEIVITAGGAEKQVREWEKRDWKSGNRPLPRLQ